MEKSKKSTKSFKNRTGKLRAKLLSSYYGNPARDLTLICITGSTGKSTVAHFIHEILNAADQRVAILSSDTDFKVSVLHKFLSNAWKSGATHAVITAPPEALKRDVFYGLPINVAIITDFIPASLNSLSKEEYLSASSTLFTMHPETVILNRDDAHYDDFAKFTGIKQTLTYGATTGSDLHILSSELYKKGTEARFNFKSKPFTVASFIPGEPTISYMAAAATVASSLNINPEIITEGISNYQPENN